MRKLLTTITFLLIAASVWAQTPSQFNGLLTTSTDYTCGGVVPCSTWPYPAMPAQGSSLLDTLWGTTTYQLGQNSQQSYPAIPVYARQQHWNIDGTKMITAEAQGGWADLYDATTTPPTPINRIVTDSSAYQLVNGINCDVGWSNTDANVLYYYPCSVSMANGPEIRSVNISTCTAGAGNCNLTSSLVKSFSCTSTALSNPELTVGTQGIIFETGSGGQGGMIDNAADFIGSCDYLDEAGRHTIDVIRYNLTTNTTAQTKWYNLCPGNTPTGCAWYSPYVATYGPGSIKNIMRMSQHPNGQYVSILWQYGPTSYDELWTRGGGAEIFDPNWNFLGVAAAWITHEDMGWDVNGIPVWVGVNAQCLYCSTNPRGVMDGPNAMEIVDLTKISGTLDAHGIPTGKIHTLMPCSYGYYSGTGTPTGGTCYAGGNLEQKVITPHISMVSTGAGGLPGYGLLSTLFLGGGTYPYTAQDKPAATTLTQAITSTGSQTFSVASVATIKVGTSISLGVTGGSSPETCKITAVSGLNVTCTVLYAHANGEAVQSVSVGDTGMGAMEMIALKIDSTQADWTPITSYYRIGRTRSIRGSNYNAEPHAAPNRNFTQIIYGSNWEKDDGTTVYGFWMPLTGGGSGPTLTSITVSLASNSVAVGSTDQASATCLWSDSSTDCSSLTFTWASSSTGVATINSSTGLATGVSAGSSTITASANSVTSNGAALTVTAPSTVQTSVSGMGNVNWLRQ